MIEKEASVYPVIDLFAGPGGLAEGFCSFAEGDKRPFRVELSIEKDPIAHSTLLLRSFFRTFPVNEIPAEYWSYAKGEITRDQLFDAYPQNKAAAEAEAKCIELGKEPHANVRSLIESKVHGKGKWVLMGGPPCQAYSLVGRSRMKSTMPDFEKDERHLLYREYLRILADHKPPVFVMENVKGLLSATHSGSRIIERIVGDLKNPDRAIHRPSSGTYYKLFSFAEKGNYHEYNAERFLIEAEKYGIPQTRHRLFIFGIREDIDITPEILTKSEAPFVEEIIGDLPQIRSALSREADSFAQWKSVLKLAQREQWYLKGRANGLLPTMTTIDEALGVIDNLEELSAGGEILKYSGKVSKKAKWYRQNCSPLVMNHTARNHMRSDLHRYLFAASYAVANGKSAQVLDFPKQLLPAHKNIQDEEKKEYFSDRFRVQIGSKPSTTITSHISKDGHYFIHYDPAQCRSLTVREAARLQTFPDNYKFEGMRTSQYHQVGNAVPPALAGQIAQIVHDVLKRIRI
jgi:DNA (cytosine-5)-methyltransferase 1